jgi:acetyl-CoA carboxylase biotin carboxyl carrier protein
MQDVPNAQEELLAQACRSAAMLAADGRPLRRLSLRTGGVEIELEWAVPEPRPQTPAPPVAEQPLVEVEVPIPAAEQAGAHQIYAESVGTFYRSSEPGATPFAIEGDVVTAGQQLGILEVMKLMIPIEADLSGRVLEFMVPDGTPVEFGAPLVSLERG